VGEASYYPAGTSMLSDYYEKARRSRAMGIWTGGAIVGIAVGYAGGAAVASRFGWRTAFFLTAIPGVVLAILAFNLREPVRGATEVGAVRARPEHRASVKTALQLWRIQTLRATILSQMLLFFVLTANAYWLQFFLTRKFHVSLAVAGLYGGGGIVLGGIIGSLLGGWLGDWRSRTRPAGNIEVTIWSFVAGAVLSVGALLAPRLATTVVLFTIAVTCLSIYNGPFTAVNQNVVVPSMRASAIMITLLIAHLGGDLFAPPIVGFLSDTLHSLQTALLIVSPAALLLAAAIAATGLKSVAGDTQAMEESWGGMPMPGVQPARA
jgi:MFS family permease